jgi:SAM-dependent methyltransferase
VSDSVTIREFTRQAASFEAPGTHFADPDVLGWIAAHVDVAGEDRVLDVAGGTGQLGRHLARSARCAVVADLTPAMLAEGGRAMREAGRRDVIFVLADAAALPFPDDQFEVVVSRFALHHMSDVGAMIAQMRRVCTPGGTVAVIDMVTDPDAVGERFDTLERLRDPSHTVTPRSGELPSLLRAAGIEPTRSSHRDERLVAEPWLDRAQPNAEARTTVLQALWTEAQGGEPTGLGATIGDDDVLTISHRYELAVGSVEA